MIDTRALADMTYGLFIVGSKDGEKFNAMIANSVFQVTAEPPKIAIALNKQSLTHNYIKSCRSSRSPAHAGYSRTLAQGAS